MVVVKTVTVREKVPAYLIQPCPKKWQKAGPWITEDFAVRGDVNEAGLDKCSGQVDGVREWNAGL
ncbi:hypothetical protein NL532_00200 [Mesorhizobium sp. C120A]|uniref:hypothetical protein n=1 Tax=unclassified Mesorhizobium TaxID=325217 RepID=UPI0003CFAB37|nr:MULTISPECIES: hypothetical protein [unclassified Mesorhizobium]ESZ63778.1 hypothetical protein X728_09285 [Mesorhizobium sp. L103C120A0]WJI45121.1 hypothetical protein NL532_00200 [Mesorhizobium sp. C120A]